MNTVIFEKHLREEPYREMVDIRPDAKLVVFKWRGRTPSDDLCEQALLNIPDCVKRAKTSWGTDGFYKEGSSYSFICDGNYGQAIVANVENGEFQELLEWLDNYFYDLGDDMYGGHWREAEGGYSKHCFSATDYTEEEIQREIDRERLWATFEPYLNQDVQ